MQLTTIRAGVSTRAARIDGDTLVPLDFPDVGALLASGSDWRERAAAASANGTRVARSDAVLAPVVTAPQKIVCSGLNYGAHAEEIGQPRPQYPTIFAKWAPALIGARDAIELPPESERVDWEAELGVVIGSPVRRVDAAGARAAIAGYVVVNDVSMRDWQGRTREWLQGKTFEASTPVGPALVTLDELDDPDDLALRCEIDGEVVQSARTSDMIFSPAALIAYVSTFVTLLPGDLILTGTPAGIGGARKPPRFLAPGETLRTVVEGVGELVNVCRTEQVEEV